MADMRVGGILLFDSVKHGGGVFDSAFSLSDVSDCSDKK